MLSYDFAGTVITNTPQVTSSRLESVAGVRSATFVFLAGSLAEARTAKATWRPIFVYAVAPDFAAEAARVGWEGPLRPTPGNVTISSGLAAALGAQVGDVIQLGRELCDPVTGGCEFRNVTYTVSSIVIRSKTDGTPLTFLFMAFIDLADARIFYETINNRLFPDPPGYLFLIWVESREVLMPLDPQGNILRISKIQRELEIQSGSTSFESPLRRSLESFGSLLIPLQALFLSLSVPALILALAVSLEAISRATHQAMKNIRYFRIRGMNQRAAFYVTMVPGLLVAIAGLLVGVWVLPWLFSVLLENLGFANEVGGLPIASLSTGIVYLLVLLALFSRRVRSGLEVLRAKWERELSPVGRFSLPTLDYALLLSGGLLWAYVGLFEVIQAFSPALDTLVGTILRTLAPVATVLVALGSIRPLLWRREIRSALASVFRTVAGPLGRRYLADRFKGATPRAGVPLVIALAVSLTLLGFISLQSENAYNEKRAAAALGGDMQVEVLGDGSLASNLSALSGITHVSEAEITSPFISMQRRVIAINTSSYHSVVGNDPYFFASVGGDVRALLEGKPAVVVNQPAAREGGLAVGDAVAVSFENRTAILSVAGIINAMPGLLPDGLSSLDEPLLYADLATLYDVVFPGAHQVGLSEWRILLRLAPGISAEALRDALFAAFPSRVLEVEFNAQSGKGGSSFVDIAASFLSVETYLSSVLVLTALSLLASTLLSEREVEVATIRVRGARRATVATFLWGELASIAVLGVLVGVPVGLTGSWFLVQALSKFIDPSVLVRPWIVPGEAIVAALSLATAALGVLFLLAWHASEPDSVRILKERSL